MKKVFILILIILVLAVLVIGLNHIKNNKIETSDQAELSLDNDISMLPTEVVEEYMNLTLGSIPGASIDYDKAKKYLSDDLKSQFKDPVFIPESYCIQDGPDAVRIASDELTGNAIKIVVEGQYSGQWQKMWQFLLVPDGNMSWLISEINCLN